MRFQRWIQSFCLVVFLALMLLAAGDFLQTGTLDFFLRLDPSLGLVSSVSARELLVGFAPAALLLVLTLFLGRFFCGHICPMGTTLDLTDSLFGVGYKKQKKPAGLRPVKYFVLIFCIAAALPGISYVFLASPLSLVTRFYGLLILPLVSLIGSRTHDLLHPLWEKLDFSSMLFFQFETQRYNTQFFILIFFAALFSLARLTPRFWCRYLCPAGALFTLFSRKPLVRRQVNDSCTSCGRCARSCAMGAISESATKETRFEDCTVCLECVAICPESAISFSQLKTPNHINPAPAYPGRRQFIISGVAGVGTTLVSLSSLDAPAAGTTEGTVAPPLLLRPPAALPELEFLARCVRCGECMVACPTNTLQPVWFEAGVVGLFSPALVPRRGYCSPDCHRCADVCPTNSIRSVSSEERIWAKTGTAVINRRKCLAWEQDKKCMVCDEVCPFGAIQFDHEPSLSVAVPHVREEHCTGCGYCEYHCPVQNQPAIIVTPMNALRLSAGSFRSAGKKAGLEISRETAHDKAYPAAEEPGSSAPGFDSRAAPGFDSDEP